MMNFLRFRSLLAFGASATALLGVSAPAFAADTGDTTIDEVVVTAQKKEERLQDVPIAVSAFNQESLDRAKIDGGPNLVLAVPNVHFTAGNFGGFNFTVRGIGVSSIAASGDPGVAIHLNNAPMLTSVLFQAEFYDLERVEVLRGPQGTLYGRNATGGVVNVITAKPSDVFEGSARVEVGNYETRRARGMINIPFNDTMALRVAGTVTKRDGYGANLTNGHDIDGRDLWAGRATLSFEPTDRARAYLTYEHFEEEDDRSTVGKQLCTKDVGPTQVGGVNITIPLISGFLSQGCLPTSVEDPSALGTINSLSGIGILGVVTGAVAQDAFAGKMQNPNLRAIEAAFDPIYRAKQDVVQLDASYDVTDDLLFSSILNYSETSSYNRSDYTRTTAVVPFNIIPGVIPNDPTVGPGGTYTDPQLGKSNLFRGDSLNTVEAKDFSWEARLQSSFNGPINFNAGALYLTHDLTSQVFALSNLMTIASTTSNGFLGTGFAPSLIDPNFDPTGDGHNYFAARTPFKLETQSAFGELYWQATEELKFTVGARYNSDKKTQKNVPVRLLTAGYGLAEVGPPLVGEFKEWSGRGGFDWNPALSFTDQTLLYGFYSRGYKPGGLNPPCSTGVNCPPPSFESEFVDAIEVGAKNTMLDGELVLNLTGFSYDYQGYQIARVVNRTSVNDNIDAKVKGFELETIWSPIRGLRLNANLGFLDTEIQGGTSIDNLDRTQGDTNFTLVNGPLVGGNCVVNTAALANAITLVQSGAVPPTAFIGACVGALAGLGVIPTGGAPVSLKGRELPRSPETTLSLGAQYTHDMGDWSATGRVDYYVQAASYARIYNSVADRIPSWNNTNLSFTVENSNLGLVFEAYGKNIFDDTPITDIFLTDDSSSLYRNIQTLEPRTFGVSVTKKW